MTAPYYSDDRVTLYHADSFELDADILLGWGHDAVLIVDPPWDVSLALELAGAARLGPAESLLTFTDARRMRDTIDVFGPPDWVFTWDTMSPWSVGASTPVQQTKHCLWYGDTYARDATLHGDPPPAKNHPGTKTVPLEGRRLTDLWRESLRWLHNPELGPGSNGTDRFTTRQGDPVMKHAKPTGWLRCLIGNTSRADTPVVDPFMGSGSAVLAGFELGRRVIGVDIDERCCEFVATRLAQGVLFHG